MNPSQVVFRKSRCSKVSNWKVTPPAPASGGPTEADEVGVTGFDWPIPNRR